MSNPVYTSAMCCLTPVKWVNMLRLHRNYCITPNKTMHDWDWAPAFITTHWLIVELFMQHDVAWSQIVFNFGNIYQLLNLAV